MRLVIIKKIRELFSYRAVLKRMVAKELKAKYVGSVLGISWAVITPLLIMLAISFVFTKIMRIDIEDFPLFVLSAILPWTFFSTALSEATSSLINNAHLLRQFNIPKEFIPLSSIIANFINFLFGLVFIIPIFVIFRAGIISRLFFLPVLLLLHLIFTAGLGMLLASVNVYFRDVSHLLGVGLLFWFWVTPIFYSLNIVPANYRWVCMLNPMTPYIVGYRNILFTARLPGLSTVSAAFCIALITLLIGYGIFIKCESSFIKRI